jgi:hypothetical protein
MRSSASSRVRCAALVAGTVAVLVALTGCVDEGSEPTLPTESPTPTASTPTPTPTASATTEPDPIAISCRDLVAPDAVYAFDPNYALVDGWTPPGGSPAAEALAAGGVTCQWVRESGGGTIDLSVARLSDDAILAKKNEAFAESQMVPTYGEEAYFEVEEGVGTAIVFEGRYWLVISSVGFAEPGEPTGIIESALGALADL